MGTIDTMRAALAGIRQDKMTVQRAEAIKTDYGAEREVFVDIHTDIPCRLSFNAMGANTDVSEQTALPNVIYEAELFYDPGYEILPGDNVVVTKCGKVFEGKAGEAMPYPSHSQVPVAMHKR